MNRLDELLEEKRRYQREKEELIKFFADRSNYIKQTEIKIDDATRYLNSDADRIFGKRK